MSQRLGMADGRCLTIHTSPRLLNDYIMTQHGIQYQNNYKFRQLLQRQGPAVLQVVQSQQQTGAPNDQSNFINRCQSCNTPLLKVPNTY
jgi:uncharacterized protein with PIN domain